VFQGHQVWAWVPSVCVYIHSATSFERLPLNAEKNGLSRQVVSHSRFILQAITREVCFVVFQDRWSLNGVVSRQVPLYIFKVQWSPS
jgi:hypothetical protein